MCAQPTDANTVCTVLSDLRSFRIISRLAFLGRGACRAELFGLTLTLMASSYVAGAAVGAPPPLDRLAVFYKLVDKQVIACVLCRHARAVELAATGGS